MSQLIEKLTEIQKYAMSIRPKIAGFPVLAEALRQSGVIMNRWTLPSCQSVYTLNEGVIVQQGNPIVTGTFEFPTFNRDALIKAIREDQEGISSFPEFLIHAWEAGIVSYDVYFTERKVIYYGVTGESYTEEYPAVDIK